ncbi:MAG: CPBP family intramembrane metalloprotease, partial [Treponema sp.]|nr:CPBP family intramembrane metalloprotease [Treponema sp.]
MQTCQKSKGSITAFIEPFILYWVLFLPSWGFPVPEAFSFSINRELGRIFSYNIPSLALIWYLFLRLESPTLSSAGLRPGRRDLLTVLFTLPGLIALGVLVSLIGSFFPSPISAPAVEAPRGLAAVSVMILSCLSTGYLEESYFRLYLFTRFRESGVSPVKGMVVSSLLFALCHVYEGPLGALNAFLAGLLLFFIFTHRQTIHGLAWAHGGYNIFVYVMAGGG